MDPLGITLWLSLTFGAPGPASWDLGGSLVFAAPVEAVLDPHTGVTLPHLILIDPSDQEDRDLMRHELVHAVQYDALGPGFLVGYLAGMGHGFEDYLGDGHVWVPPPEDSRTCPFLRVESGTASLLPCWRFF